MGEDRLFGSKCRNCGIELIMRNQPTDTFCRFCGAPALMPQSFETESAPEFVIPFEIDKSHAQQILLKHLTKRPLASPVFTQKVKSGNFAALYVPVCLADIEMQTAVSTADTNGNKKTEQMTSVAKNMLTSASRTVNDYLLRDLGPFSFDRAVAYGSEYSEIPYERAETANEEDTLTRPIDELETSCVKAATDMLAQQEKESHIVNCRRTGTSFNCKKVLVPVWVLNFNDRGYAHQIFLNGQSGKVIGEPPVSFRHAAAIFGVITAACTVLGEIIWMAVNRL